MNDAKREPSIETKSGVVVFSNLEKTGVDSIRYQAVESCGQELAGDAEFSMLWIDNQAEDFCLAIESPHGQVPDQFQALLQSSDQQM
jgi:hypothetical protein